LRCKEKRLQDQIERCINSISVTQPGVLLLDENGTLGLDGQAMLLRALEEKSFLPLGADPNNR